MGVPTNSQTVILALLCGGVDLTLQACGHVDHFIVLPIQGAGEISPRGEERRGRRREFLGVVSNEASSGADWVRGADGFRAGRSLIAACWFRIETHGGLFCFDRAGSRADRRRRRTDRRWPRRFSWGTITLHGVGVGWRCHLVSSPLAEWPGLAGLPDVSACYIPCPVCARRAGTHNVCVVRCETRSGGAAVCTRISAPAAAYLICPAVSPHIIVVFIERRSSLNDTRR